MSTPPGWIDRLRAGLSQSASRLSMGLSRGFDRRRVDAQTCEDLEDILIQADLGVETAQDLVAAWAQTYRGREVTADLVRQSLAEAIAERLQPVAQALTCDGTHQPMVVLVVGANGAGKTTTIGKLASQEIRQGRRVMMVAGDTFRPAAVEQLQIWGTRCGVPVVAGPHGADAAGLAYDACVRACQEKTDMVLVDTAGRLHTKSDLMAQLQKIHRVIGKAQPGAPHAVVLVIEAGAGQNTLTQVRAFQDMVPVSGLILTKIDGTAHGGILVALAETYRLPVHAVGVGEGVDDLQPFSPHVFARALVGLENG